jgi:CHAD domain-containing protein
MGSAALFASQFKKSARRVKGRLVAYMKEPENDEKVHDVRTSLRRLEATFLLMPKKLRRRNRRQIELHKKFFRANSRVRDYDIIRCRIVARVHGDLLSQLVADLDKRRKVEVEMAVGLARLVSMLPEASSEGLEEAEVKSRMDKVADRLLRKMEERIPTVIADGRNVEELHRLRKDLKKLRYVLEVMPDGIKKPHEKKISRILKGTRVEERLEELQDTLGTIHDIDITVQYLTALRKKILASIIEGERSERDKLFRKFAKDFSS